jgi:hypothetical protein
VLIIPAVDVYSAEKSEREALQEELKGATELAAQLPQYEIRVSETVAQLTALESRTAEEERLPELRDRLVESARETGCSLRRLNVGGAITRPWHQGDDPIAQNSGVKPIETATGFTLQWRPVTISLTGTIDCLRNFLEQLKADDMFAHAKTFEMYPSPQERKTLTLEMEIWYFALARGE